MKISENIKSGPKNLKNVSPENLGKKRTPSPGKIPTFVIGPYCMYYIYHGLFPFFANSIAHWSKILLKSVLIFLQMHFINKNWGKF